RTCSRPVDSSTCDHWWHWISSFCRRLLGETSKPRASPCLHRAGPRQLHVSERRACAALGQHRSTPRKVPRGRDDEQRLTAVLSSLPGTTAAMDHRRPRRWRTVSSNGPDRNCREYAIGAARQEHCSLGRRIDHPIPLCPERGSGAVIKLGEVIMIL